MLKNLLRKMEGFAGETATLFREIDFKSNPVQRYTARGGAMTGILKRIVSKPKGYLRGTVKVSAAAGLLLASAAAAPTAWAQSSLPTFACDGFPYQVLSGELNQFDPITLTYTPIGTTINPAVNGIGFNHLDGYAYGMAGGNNGDLYRLGSNGERELVSTGIDGAVWFNGAMDESGNLYSQFRTNRSQLVKIDIAASEASGTTVSTLIPLTGPTPVGTGDLVWAINGGVEYILFARGTTIYYYNLSTNVITTKAVSLPAGTSSVSFGAMWSDESGRLWGFNNNTGEIFEILNAFASTPSMVLIANTTPNGSNDGFSCSQEIFPNLPPLAFDDDYVTTLDTPVTSNVIQDNGNGADEDPEGLGLTVTVLPVAGTGPSNGSVTFSPNGDFTYTPTAGFFGTDTFDYIVADVTGITATATVTILIEHPEMSLTKTASNDKDVVVGEVITYTYVVENTGNVTMSDVTITDAHSGTGTLGAISPATVASLAVGASAIFTADYTVTQADIVAGTPITNTATADATPAVGIYTPVTADESIAPEAPAPSLSMDKAANNPGPYLVGDIVTYTYTITNKGNVAIRDITINDTHNGSDPAPLPESETLLTDVTPIGDSSDSTSDGSWDVLSPGDIITFTGTYTITQIDAENL